MPAACPPNGMAGCTTPTTNCPKATCRRPRSGKWITPPTPPARADAYRPQGALERGGKRAAATGDYEAWTPDALRLARSRPDGFAVCCGAGGCGNAAPEPEARARPKCREELVQPTADAPTVGDIEAIGTPMEERVATLGLLNKRNNISQDIEMKPGRIAPRRRRDRPAVRCERTAPWEMPGRKPAPSCRCS